MPAKMNSFCSMGRSLWFLIVFFMNVFPVLSQSHSTLDSSLDGGFLAPRSEKMGYLGDPSFGLEFAATSCNQFVSHGVQPTHHELAFARFYIVSAAPQGVREIESGPLMVGVSGFGKNIQFKQGESPFPMGFRFGEAKHPGPDVVDWTDTSQLLRVGVSNSTGLRMKEPQVISLGSGLWHFAETHLTDSTSRSCSKQLKYLTKINNRKINFLTGCHAPTRANSDWAGAWTGVAQVTDLAATRLNLDIKPDHWASARLLASRQWAGSLAITSCTFYGYPVGPTWPRAKALSNCLLEAFTRDIVYGSQGVRCIGGDFNDSPGALRQQQLWAQCGWVNAQSLAVEKFSHQWTATCKFSTEPDQLWLSPEAAVLMRKFEVKQCFADHATIIAYLEVPKLLHQVWRWPLPSEIDWGSFPDYDCYVSGHFDPGQCYIADPDGSFASWASRFEDGVHFHLTKHGQQLKEGARGRGQRTSPMSSSEVAPVCVQSRPGEIEMKSDVLGRAVLLWFKQARRLQSLVHALKAGKMTKDAVEYRDLLWSSILSAKGFQSGFREWWRKKELICIDAPSQLFAVTPGLIEVQLIFQEFMAHFRKFESWNLRERNEKLQAKYKTGLQQLMKELRAEKQSAPVCFWEEKKFEIMALELESGQIELDQEPSIASDHIWLFEGENICLSNFDGTLCVLGTNVQVERGDVFVQRIFSSTVSEMHAQLVSFWQPRWRKLADLPEDTWARIVDFVTAYMPRLSFSWAPINREDWRQAALKMKTRAARGTDGIARLDMARLSDVHLDELLHLLEMIETQGMNWPKQILVGIVTCVAKISAPALPAHYRPISVFSIIYRIWSGLRTRQFLWQIKDLLPAGICGFVPQCEAAQIWAGLQGWIELSLVEGTDLVGMSSDLQRAFNHIGRRQTFLVAEKVGLPQELLRPWGNFIANVERRFDLFGQLSQPVLSTSGFPEGDPLSILAMLLANWSHHQYLAAFNPKINAITYVDNVSLIGQDCVSLFQGLASTKIFYGLWGLDLDDQKTFSWGITAELRAQLRLWDVPVQEIHQELGGQMSYSRRCRNKLLRDRGEGLSTKWTRLQRSPAPAEQKLQVLPLVFWPASLHGVANCHLSSAYIQNERRKASKALAWNAAGTNLQMKFSLSSVPLADPGFFQLVTTFSTFTRLLAKSDEFGRRWSDFLEVANSKLPGPYSKFIQQIEQIEWAVLSSHQIIDHRGDWHDLFHFDRKLVFARLYEAWVFHITGKVKHKTMDDLLQLEIPITLHGMNKLSPLLRARVAALHSGAFISASQKSKFDPSQTDTCDVCNTRDDRKHWLTCPKFAPLRENFPEDDSWIRETPNCTLFHLLVPWDPDLHVLEKHFPSISTEPHQFDSYETVEGIQHVFSDGSCHGGACPYSARAAWALVHSGTSHTIVAAHLAGPRQCIDRAETEAIIAAAAWSLLVKKTTWVWSDSKSCVHTAKRVIEQRSLIDVRTNGDLWYSFLQLILQMRDGQFDVLWTPAHLDGQQTTDAFEDWLHRWNNWVDWQANLMNMQRPFSFWQDLTSVQKKSESWHQKLKLLRTFYLRIAEGTGLNKKKTSKTLQPVYVLEDDHDCTESIPDCLPLNWKHNLPSSTKKLPSWFYEEILNWLIQNDAVDGPLQLISEVELAIALAADSSFHFPAWDSQRNTWSPKSYSMHFERPTLSTLIRLIFVALDVLAGHFDFVGHLAKGVRRETLGIFRPGRGLYIRWPLTLRHQVVDRLGRLVSRRSIRVAADLARPLV